MSKPHLGVQRVRTAAFEVGVEIRVIEYPEGTHTAEDAAAAINCQVDQIVKSMIFQAGDEIVLALTSGVHQVDPGALASSLKVDECARADADAVRQTTGFAIGGVPPFAHTTALRTVIDPHLLDFSAVWAAAGTPRHVFAIAPNDLVKLSGAVVADFTRT